MIRVVRLVTVVGGVSAFVDDRSLGVNIAGHFHIALQFKITNNLEQRCHQSDLVSNKADNVAIGIVDRSTTTRNALWPV
ncbi:hypothetical protein D3C80_1946270 [compost metagenome]